MNVLTVFQCAADLWHLRALRRHEERQTQRMFRFAGQILAFGLIAAAIEPAAAAPTADAALAIVTGVAPGDLLNVREAASPVGHIRTRLGNGTGLRNFGCDEFNGYRWCKIAVVDQPDVEGWVPGRYLLPVDPESTATPTLEEADREAAADASALALPATADGTDSEEQAAATPHSRDSHEPARQPALPVDLAARFGDAPAAAPDAPEAVASLGLTAAESVAYRLAFATQAEAMAAKNGDAPDATAVAAPDTVPPPAVPSDAESGQPSVQADAGTATVPIPTPRPDLEKARADAAGNDSQDDVPVQVASAAPALADNAAASPATPAPQIVALADPQSFPPTWDATGEIPCARYVGQPMTRCQAGVRREGTGKADVTVTWPDGGTRVIGFYDGKPAGANARGEFRFTREGDLNMIRVGVSERFEITDGLAFGD